VLFLHSGSYNYSLHNAGDDFVLCSSSIIYEYYSI
jgi:hypothetical protein